MAQYNPMTARRIVTEINRTQAAFDSTLKRMAQLTLTMLEASGEAKLPAMASQAALEKMSSGLSQIVAGRGDFVVAHHTMVQMKKSSNLRQVEIGCTPGPACESPFVESAALRSVA